MNLIWLCTSLVQVAVQCRARAGRGGDVAPVHEEELQLAAAVYTVYN